MEEREHICICIGYICKAMRDSFFIFLFESNGLNLMIPYLVVFNISINGIYVHNFVLPALIYSSI